jgi:hypothetical protein
VQIVRECKLGFVPSRFLQVDAQDATPRRVGSVGLVPDYRVDALCARSRARLQAQPAHPSAVLRPNLWLAKPPRRDARAARLGVERNPL